MIGMWCIVLLSVIGCAVAGPPVSRSRADIEAFKTYLENSRTGDGIRLESRMLANPKAAVWENSGRFEGDILLDDEQAEMMLQDYAEGRNAYIWPNTKWPSNTIVYEFNNEFTTAQINAIYAGMREVSSRTCIRFRRRASGERNYVRITGDADGCYAHVGYWASRGVHIYNVARNTPGRGCFTHTVIIHEWLHVAGFMHMHSTHNRDTYVRIMWQNIMPGMDYAFERYGTNVVHNMGLPYEYASNMHYDRFGFSRNGQPTMLPIFNDNNQMGQRQFVTSWDWLRANRHYNCPGAWSTPVDTNEQSPGINLQQMPQEENVAEDVQEETVVEDDVAEDIPKQNVANE